jgi:ABC-2 type transport system permease protein
MEEKNQRIAEVLLGSMTPFQFMMGKILGALAVSLTGSLVYVSAIAATLYKMDLHTLIPFSLIPWLLAYLFLAVVMYGAIFASLGSACNDAKDAQSMQLPAMLPLIIPMFVLIPLIQQPQSSFALGMSLVPPFTPMVMMLRLSTPGGIPAWQPWAGLAGVLLFTLFCVWAGGRIFRVAILMQGKPPKIPDLIRWVFKG